MNKITGEKTIEIDGNKYVLRYTWRALAEVESQHGESPNLFNAETLAAVAAAGFREHHPELTAERIMGLSPPLVPLATAVQEAIQWAYFGGGALPEAGQDVKKNRPTAGLWKRFVSLFGGG